LPGQKTKIFILLVLRSVRNQRIGLLKGILSDSQRITFVCFRLSEFGIAILLHLVWIDQTDWEFRLLKGFQKWIMIVAGRLHKNGWRFGSPLNVIDQCLQLISDMVDIKGLSTDGAITI